MRIRSTSSPSEAPPRPGWMTGLTCFCVATVVFLASRDLFFAETRDVEVWFGYEVRGTAALLSAPVHWAIFAAGAWGFWNQHPRVLAWASGYVFYVALSHIVWSGISPNGDGWPAGFGYALAISIPGAWLVRTHQRRRNR